MTVLWSLKSMAQFVVHSAHAKEGKSATYFASPFPAFQDKVHLISKLISHPCYKYSVK